MSLRSRAGAGVPDVQGQWAIRVTGVPCHPRGVAVSYARRWRAFRRRQWPFVLLAAGLMGVMVFTVSVVEVAPDLRGWAALGLLVSVLLAARGLRASPGGLRAYVDLPGDRL